MRDRRRILSEYLVICAQSGDRAAFSRLARLWQAGLMRHARRLTDTPSDAEDVMQDAWLDICRGLKRLRAPGAFPAWAWRIVSRKAAARVRTRQGERHLAQRLEGEWAGNRVDGEAVAEVATDLATVGTVMARLPEAQRIALAMYHQDGLTITEIAVALGIPAGTVKTRLMHARRKVRAALEPDREGDSDDTK